MKNKFWKRGKGE